LGKALRVIPLKSPYLLYTASILNIADALSDFHPCFKLRFLLGKIGQLKQNIKEGEPLHYKPLKGYRQPQTSPEAIRLSGPETLVLRFASINAHRDADRKPAIRS
jgi:hypothetical protein